MIVQEGQELTVKVISIGRKGDGIAKHEDFVIVIPRTQLNQEYDIKITKVYNKYAFAIKQEDTTKWNGE